MSPSWMLSHSPGTENARRVILLSTRSVTFFLYEACYSDLEPNLGLRRFLYYYHHLITHNKRHYLKKYILYIIEKLYRRMTTKNVTYLSLKLQNNDKNTR